MFLIISCIKPSADKNTKKKTRMEIPIIILWYSYTITILKVQYTYIQRHRCICTRYSIILCYIIIPNTVCTFSNHIEQTCRIFRSCLECMLTVEDGNVTISNVGCNDTCPVIVVTHNVMIEGGVKTLCILYTPVLSKCTYRYQTSPNCVV